MPSHGYGPQYLVLYMNWVVSTGDPLDVVLVLRRIESLTNRYRLNGGCGIAGMVLSRANEAYMNVFRKLLH